MPAKEYKVLPRHFICHSWPTYFLNHTYSSLIRNDFLKTERQLTIKKLFICKNNRARNHRAQLMDHLYSNNLLEHGHVSWHGTDKELLTYQFKYWHPEVLTLDQEYQNNHKPVYQFFQPYQSDLSLIELVTETEVDYKFITEKSYVPIFYKKPFLILGSKNIHKILKDQGFELFEEIIDYSFDSLDSAELRMQGIIKNLDKLKSKDYNSLYSMIKDKLAYNYEHAVQMAYDKSLIPEIVFEVTGFKDYSSLSLDLYKRFGFNICKYSN
jgi:hypothetical protein